MSNHLTFGLGLVTCMLDLRAVYNKFWCLAVLYYYVIFFRALRAGCGGSLLWVFSPNYIHLVAE